MKLLLHIGTEKTGTTSAQRWFSDNFDALRTLGIFYSKALCGLQSRGLSLLCAENQKALLADGTLTPAERARHRAMLGEEFRAEVGRARDSGAHTFVISNEHSHSRMVRPEHMRRATELLQPLFADIEVLCFLRPQVDMAVSLASTLSRAAERVDQAFLDSVNPENPYYDYHLLARRWSTAFGHAALRLLSCRRWPTLAHYLIDRLALDAGSLEAIPRVNEAVDYRTIAMTNQIGLDLFLPDGSFNPFSQMFIDRVECKETLQLGLDRARLIQARFARSNQALLRDYPEFPAADLEPDWQRYDRPSNFEAIEQPCVFAEQARQMLRAFNEQLVLQRAQNALARARLALLRRDLALAQKEASGCGKLLQAFGDASARVEGLPGLRGQLMRFEARLREHS